MTRKKKIIGGIILLILAIAIAIVGILLLRKRLSPQQEQNPFAAFEEMGIGQDAVASMVAGSGVTGIGMVQEVFPVEELTESLEVEEVLIESGAEVAADTAIVKFTDSSLQAVRESLEKTLRDADLAYRSGKIEYEQAVIQAKAEYQTSLLNGKYAESVYEETVAGLEGDVEEAQELYNEAQAQLTEFETNLANGTYAANVEKWQKAYDSNYKLLVETMETWGFQWTEVTAGRRGNGWGATEREQYLQASQDLYDALEICRKYLDEAEEEYEEKVTNAAFYRQMLELELPELKEAYATAQADYETSLVQAKLTRETSLAEAALAEKNYETDIEKAESELETLENAFEDAEENLKVFEAQMGTGYYYPVETGTVFRVSVRVGAEITSGNTILMLSDYEEMTVTVSVDQNDISKINVGDTALVYSEDSGTAEGVVKSINPVSNSSGRSSITYSVTVEMTGDTPFGNNESVSVYFTVGGDDEEA